MTGYDAYKRICHVIPLYSYMCQGTRRTTSLPRYVGKENKWDDLAQKLEYHSALPEEYAEFICKYIKRPYTSVILSSRVFNSFIQFRHTNNYTTHFLSKAVQIELLQLVRDRYISVTLPLSVMRGIYLGAKFSYLDNVYNWEKLLENYSLVYLSYRYHQGTLELPDEQGRIYNEVISTRYMIYFSVIEDLEKMTHESLEAKYCEAYDLLRRVEFLTFDPQLERAYVLDLIRKTWIPGLHPEQYEAPFGRP